MSNSMHPLRETHQSLTDRFREKSRSKLDSQLLRVGLFFLVLFVVIVFLLFGFASIPHGD